MKYLMKTLLAAMICIGAMAAAFAADAVYPYSSPTYIPNAVASAQTVSAPTSILFTSNGLGTVAVDIRGTCTSLAATVQGSIDGTNYVAVNVFPITTGTITPASAVSAVGQWRTDAAAFVKMRVNITALTAACTFSIVGSQASFTGTY